MKLVPMTTTAVVAVRSHDWFTTEERAAVAGFLAGDSGLTREAYELDLRQNVLRPTIHTRCAEPAWTSTRRQRLG